VNGADGERGPSLGEVGDPRCGSCVRPAVSSVAGPGPWVRMTAGPPPLRRRMPQAPMITPAAAATRNRPPGDMHAIFREDRDRRIRRHPPVWW